jgi:hypothetical protein
MEMALLKTRSKPLNGFTNPQKADMELHSTNSAVCSMIQMSSLARTIMGNKSVHRKRILERQQSGTKRLKHRERNGQPIALPTCTEMFHLDLLKRLNCGNVRATNCGTAMIFVVI